MADVRSTTRGTTGTDRFVTATMLVAALVMLVAGVWALVAPESFADQVRFPDSHHFVHDAGAFQIGIGLTLLLAVLWRDPPTVVLAAFLAGNTLHAVNHGIDLDIGGRASDAWLLGALSVLTAAALAARCRQLGYVVGRVEPASDATLARFVDQKTAVLTTFRRDGRPVPTPLSVAVDGDRAYVRTFEKAGKAKRLRNDPRVELAPSTTRGTVRGAAVPARARQLDGTESRRAGRLLARKHPMLHGVLVPLLHRLGRARTGRTVHYELVPTGS